MAIFGDDVENYAQQQPQQQQSFFGGVGSFLWSAVKFVAVAALTVTGVGALFSYSEKTRVFVDKYTGPREGEGLGTDIANTFNKAVDTVKEFFNPAPTTTEVSFTKKIGDNNILIPISEKIIPENPGKFSELSKGTEAGNKLDVASVSYKKQAESNKNPDATQEEFLYSARNMETWNKAVDKHLDSNPGSVIIPPKIKLQLPALTDNLEQYGKDSDEKWSEKSKLEKITFLSNAFKYNDSRPDLKKISLNTENRSGEAVTFVNGVMDTISETAGRNIGQDVPILGPMSDIIKYSMAPVTLASRIDNVVANTEAGRKLIPDVGLEIAWKESISHSIDSGDLDKAAKIAKEGKAYFEGRMNKLDKVIKNNKEEGERYTNVVSDFENIDKYLTGLKARDEFGPVIDKTNKAIDSAIKELSGKLSTYMTRVNELEYMVKVNESEKNFKTQDTQSASVQTEKNAASLDASTGKANTVSGTSPDATPLANPGTNTARAESAAGNGSGNKDGKDTLVSSLDKDYARLLMNVDSVKISPNSTLPSKRKEEASASINV